MMKRQSQNTWFSRWFNEDYLEDASGLEIRWLFGSYDGRPLTPESPRAIVFAQAAMSPLAMAIAFRTATRAALVALVWSTLLASQAVAQTPPNDLARDVERLRAEIQQLRTELDALKRPPTSPSRPEPIDGRGAAADTQASSAIEMLQTQVAELAQGKVESTSRLPVRLFGTVHAGVFANSGNANWLDNPNLVGATPAGTGAGTTSASLRQTRIGFAEIGRAHV